MRLTIFGTGYVGLVAGACFADVGHHVCCVDIDEAKIEGLRNGIIPIFEPGLGVLIERNAKAGRLSFSTDHRAATLFGEIIFIAVGTPPEEDGSADLSHVLSAARMIGDNLDGYKLVVDKSTVPVGTAEQVAKQIVAALRQRNETIAFDVCSNPEFLKEGDAIEDFTKAARIIVGTDSDRARKLMRDCYAPYSRNHDKLMFMDVRSAELTKYAANAMLATKISFMNEIANLAERLDADVEHVRMGIGSDVRIGYHFIYPGCGYGGSCFPKDVRALVQMANTAGMEAPLLKAVETTNGRQKNVLFRKLDQIFDGDLRDRTFAVWGLSFKPDTDDMREAPSRMLIDALLERGATVRAYDPVATESARSLYGELDNLVLTTRREDAVPDADALIICTEWKQFRIVDFGWLKSTLRTPIVVDGRNLYEPGEMRAHGLLYYAIGRGNSASLYVGKRLRELAG